MKTVQQISDELANVVAGQDVNTSVHAMLDTLIMCICVVSKDADAAEKSAERIAQDVAKNLAARVREAWLVYQSTVELLKARGSA